MGKGKQQFKQAGSNETVWIRNPPDPFTGSGDTTSDWGEVRVD